MSSTSSTLKTPAEWLAQEYPTLHIEGWEGWERDNKPHDAPLTLEDFERRLEQSSARQIWWP